MELTEEHYRVAKVAYDAYVKQAGGVSLATGDKLPEFSALKPSIRDAWAASGIAIKLGAWNRDDEQCLKLGREIVRMIHDVAKVAKTEAGYARRTFTFPGGSVELLLANDKKLADLMEAAASGEYSVRTATPPSQVN